MKSTATWLLLLVDVPSRVRYRLGDGLGPPPLPEFTDVVKNALIQTAPSARRVALAGLLLLAAGCYSRQGHRWDASPATLIRAARSACQRNDHRAEHTLLARLVSDYPRTREADWAQTALEDEPPCASYPDSSAVRNNPTTDDHPTPTPR